MLKPSMELTTDLKISPYSLAVGIAKRARRIAEDAEIRGEIMDDKPVDVAVEQYLNHEFSIVETEPCPVCGRLDCICGARSGKTETQVSSEDDMEPMLSDPNEEEQTAEEDGTEDAENADFSETEA